MIVTGKLSKLANENKIKFNQKQNSYFSISFLWGYQTYRYVPTEFIIG